ncbi:hypothetical protein IFM89_003478 [Coptis chinensis]|uniref:Non-specific lipid-transfer protein n=1 Tax=Coptis chinensis TaxID=261450 RepID=A0A835LQD7_9MAGN|nr:hypothetical protein IFM89_003478 [Coptis chinensis]
MANTVILKLVCVVFACIMVTAPYVEGAVTCGLVASQLTPCISYLRSGGSVPPVCCKGVRSLNTASKTTADRQTVCRCLEDAARNYSGNIKLDKAGSIPKQCGVYVAYPISTSVDCSKLGLYVLPVTWSYGKNYGITMNQLASWWSERPAKLAGLDLKGAITSGNHADLVVWESNVVFDLDENHITYHKNHGKHALAACGVPILEEIEDVDDDRDDDDDNKDRDGDGDGDGDEDTD